MPLLHPRDLNMRKVIEYQNSQNKNKNQKKLQFLKRS